MDEQLDFAPCGFVSLADDGTILSINHTLLRLLEFNLEDVQGKHINLILTKSTKVFYQLYFFPMIKMHEKIEEMFFTLKSKNGSEIPVLLNAFRHKRNGIVVNDCVFLTMKKRYEYEQVILTARKAAEERNLLKKKAINELEQVRRELESKQKELLELNEKLQKLAITDELTGLHNRRSYRKALTQNLFLFSKTSTPFSLLIIDIDHFKNINDTYGHLTGDQILKELAKILNEESREYDILARYGGEEFALILPNTNIPESKVIAERIRNSVENAPLTVPSVTISIGIATTINDDTKMTIQTRADKALYVSKNRGRNQITHASHLNLV